MHGNVVDLAVGVIIGAAFGKIVDALVTNVVMPPLGILTGDIDLSDRVIILSSKSFATLAEARAAHVPMITYGLFLNAIINFLIVSFTIFLCVRVINKIHRKPEPLAPAAEKGLPVLSFQHSASGHPLPPMHLDAGAGRAVRGEAMTSVQRGGAHALVDHVVDALDEPVFSGGCRVEFVTWFKFRRAASYWPRLMFRRAR